MTIITTPEQPTLNSKAEEEPITASLTVTNTGPVAGAEIVQLWVLPAASATTINRPVRELKGFVKVFLQPGESKRTDISVDKKVATSWWDEQRGAWASEKGRYEVLVTGTGEEELRGEFEVGKTRFWVGL